ncbi:MAG: efflux RND transporter permease subunit [Mariniblastus sp.]|nr:efflux RND transporter permease subunit [Mariniblastus sp.]
MSTRFSLATSWIVDRRWLSSLLVVALSLIAIGGYVAPEKITRALGITTDRSLETPTDDLDDTSEDSDSERPPEVETIPTSGFDVVIVVESEQFFTSQGSEAIRSIVRNLEAQDYVDNILWMDKIPSLNIFGLNEPLLPNREAAPERFAKSKQNAREHPLINGQFLSDDGNTLLLMVRFNYLFVDDESIFISGIRETAEQELANHPNVDMDFFVTGRVPFRLTAQSSQQDNQLKYQSIAYGMIILMSMVLFRGIVAVGIVAAAPFLGVFWTLGFVRYLGLQMNPFIDVVLPILVALVAFTDGVHLMVQIRHERATGLKGLDAAREGVRKVGLACFLTSLTTAVGFGSLALANHELVRDFGYCCVFGVGLAFLSVVLAIPLACSTWLGQRIHIGYGKGYVDRNINRISGIVDIVLRYPRRMSAVGIILSLVLFSISLTLRPDDRLGDLLPTYTEPAIANQKMDVAMGGLSQASITIKWDSKDDEQAKNIELFQILQEIDELLTAEKLIGHPISIYNLLEALPGSGPPATRISMLDLLPPSLKRSYYTPENRVAQVKFRVQDLGIATYGPVFQRIQDGTNRIISNHSGFSMSLGGAPIWRWENIYQIVVDLVTSLGTAAIIIFFILACVYRSLRIGIISILPNLFPLCVAGTYLALTGQALEIVTVCAFTCCLGIAVDDTIHFLTRYVEEKKETSDESEAIRKAFTSVGTALIMTTLVLVCGFMTVMLSEAREHRIFASMGAITVASALFGDLVFLPAILKTFSAKKRA